MYFPHRCRLHIRIRWQITVKQRWFNQSVPSGKPMKTWPLNSHIHTDHDLQTHLSYEYKTIRSLKKYGCETPFKPESKWNSSCLCWVIVSDETPCFKFRQSETVSEGLLSIRAFYVCHCCDLRTFTASLQKKSIREVCCTAGVMARLAATRVNEILKYADRQHKGLCAMMWPRLA